MASQQCSLLTHLFSLLHTLKPLANHLSHSHSMPVAAWHPLGARDVNKPHLSWLPGPNGQVRSALWERCCPVRHKIPGFSLEAAPETAGMKGSRALLLVALTLFCICLGKDPAEPVPTLLHPNQRQSPADPTPAQCLLPQPSPA
ncbi:secretoglobin family 1C member 1 isoform X4 [Symphalangus syndactylus]|uniref:secretoglobin family 1C member 1 isoform X4 n=1 Tax=Symphalangus syndactylus TaxID=9590 RepID=UPI003003EB94